LGWQELAPMGGIIGGVIGRMLGMASGHICGAHIGRISKLRLQAPPEHQ